MGYTVYRRDDEATRAAVASGEEHEMVESEYGKNEHILDFMRSSGFWERLVSLRPNLKKDNGEDYHLLNGLLVVFNLMHLGHLSQAGPVLRDGKLLMEVGFTVEDVKEVEEEGKGVVHEDTLRNHLQRVVEEESKRVFYDAVSLMRRKKWIRGKVYAADGFRIEVHGKTYERAGRVWDPDERRWVRGYKVVILLNVSEKRERIVGVAIGPLGTDERALLLRIMDDISGHLCPAREMIDLLILDRGYWGAEFLSRLKGEYGVDFLTLVPSNVSLVDDVRGLAQLPEHEPREAQVRKGGKRKGRVKTLAVSKIPDVEYCSDGHTIRVNAVLARDVDKETGEAHESVYVTTSPLGRQVGEWIEEYGRRWTIENEGIRELSQRWKVRTLVGRKFCAIWAQVVILMALYNATKVYEMKRPADAERLREEMRLRGRRSYLLGYTVAVFVPKKRVYTVMNARAYATLLAALARDQTLANLGNLVSGGMSLEQAIEAVKRDPH